MNDLREAFEMIKKLYLQNGMNFGNIEEVILGNKWNMVSDDKQNISLALKQGSEITSVENLKKYIGFRADKFVEALLTKDDTYRGVLSATLNLLSKPLNSKDMLLNRGIERTQGLNFNYDVTGKKVGLIGFGVYIKFFIDKCAEFHAFDFRKPETILSKRINDEVEQYPGKISFHLGNNALEHMDILRELDIVIMTGATIVNNSYLNILDMCKNAEIKGIYGPSAELLPDYLFSKGYNYIFSTSIKDKDKYLEDSLAPWPNFSEFDHMNLYELKLK